MKHYLRSILFAMMAILVPALAQAHDFVVDGIYYNITSDNEVAVTYPGSTSSSVAYSGEIMIPRTVTYDGNTYNVTSIGKNAFMSCYNLKGVNIANSVTTIGDAAFAFCDGLTSIIIPNSVTDLGKMTFMDCQWLQSVTISNSVTAIGDDTFFGCSYLWDVSIPSSVTRIGNSAFYGCYLWNLTIPNSVTYIGDYAFANCTGLSDLTISHSTATIGDYAFSNCNGLTTITIPSSVSKIGKNPFAGCTTLKSITVESGNTKYDSREGCNAIIETATNKLISGCYRSTILGSVTSIGAYAFDGSIGRSGVTIPKSVIAIEGNPFTNCSGLDRITVESGNPKYDSRDGCNAIIETASNKLISGCIHTTIPNSVTALGEESFEGCEGMTTINIPNTITSIGAEAFEGCTGLKSVAIPNQVEVIEDYVFYGCSNLASVTMPKTITSIGEYAFYYCSKLTSIDIPASVTSIGDYAFEQCTSLTDVYSYIKSPADMSVGDDAFGLYSMNYAGRTLYVPAGTSAAYKADRRWNRFFRNVVEMDDENPGDVNGDGSVNISDVSLVIDAILSGGEFNSALDVNGDGSVNISDINAIIAIILQ